MNILVTPCEKYLKYLINLLFSLKKYNDDITVYLMYEDISEKKIRRFVNKVKDEIGCDCIAIRVGKEVCAGLPIYFKRITPETYLRLFAPFYLPNDLERILYIDIDVIAQKSIKEFYYQDFEGKSLIVIPRTSSYDKNHNKKIGVSENHIYFNAGVLLMNLNKIRNNIRIEDILDIIDKKREYLILQDQDVLNIMFEKDVKHESTEYNYQLIFKTSFDMEELKRAHLIHYNGPEKPWRIKCINESSAAYWEIMKERGYVIKPKVVFALNKIYSSIRKCYFKIRWKE